MYPWVDGAICKECAPGEHIELRCKNHQHLTWSTKNLGYIGARTIFFDLYNKATERACDCPADKLYHPKH